MNIKRTLTLAVATAGMLALPLTAGAEPFIAAETAAGSERDVAIGLTVGEPTGASAWFENGRTALVLAAGVDYEEHGHAHLDYVGDVAYLAPNNTSVTIPVYVGLGGFIKDHPDDVGPHAGLRVPIGVQAEFSAPIHIYGEVVPRVVLVEPDRELPHRTVTVVGAAGVRATF